MKLAEKKSKVLNCSIKKTLPQDRQLYTQEKHTQEKRAKER